MHHRALLSAAAALFALSGLAPAQNADQQPTAPLGGPKVTENKIPGVQQTFGDAGKDPNRRKDGRGVPPEVVRKALAALDRDDTPADARLTDEQRSKIKSLMAEFESSIAAYKSAHKAEFDEARRALGDEGATLKRETPAQGKGKGKDKGKGDQPPAKGAKPPASAADSEKTAAARQKMEDLRRGAPNPIDLQTKVWNILTEPQHAIVQAEAESLMKAREEVMAREFVHKRLNKKGGPVDRQAPALKADGTIDLDKLPPKLRDRIAAMTPEEREAAIAKFRERMKNGESPDQSPKKHKRDAGTGKPPPPMKDVPTPSPEDPEDR